MQAYIVIGLVALAAGYVAYIFLRRLGFLGAPAGCGCGCEGCASLPARAGRNGSGLSASPLGNAESACCGCSGGCGRKNSCAGPLEMEPRG